MMKKYLFFFSFFVMILGLSAQVKIGDYITVSGWVDVPVDFSWSPKEDKTDELDFSSTFKVRRARLNAVGQFTDEISFRIQGDFGQNPSLVDAYVKLDLSRYVKVQVGQYKIPFTLEVPYLPTDLETIDMAQAVNMLAGYNGSSTTGNYKFGRDIGLMLSGNAVDFKRDGKTFPLVKYDVGLFNGSGVCCSNDNDSYNVVGRLQLFPFTPKLVISGSLYYGNFMRFDQNKNEYEADRNRFSVGAQYDDKTLVVRSEYIEGTTGFTDNFEVAPENKNARGYYVVAGYWFKWQKSNFRLRPVVRLDCFDSQEVTLRQRKLYYTVGIDCWKDERFRTQVNYTLRDLEGCDVYGHYLVAQFSVRF